MAAETTIAPEEKTDANQPEVKFELNASEEELLEEFGVLMAIEYGYMS